MVHGLELEEHGSDVEADSQHSHHYVKDQVGFLAGDKGLDNFEDECSHCLAQVVN